MTTRHITYMPLSVIVPADVNPKMHDIPSLIASLTRYGWTNPVLVDERTGKLVGGHGRREALISMRANGDPMPGGVFLDDDGEWLIPVMRGWHSRDDTEAKAYIVADNRIGEAGGWHMVSLASLLEEVITTDAPLMETLGYTSDALDDLLRRVDPDLIADKDPDEPTATQTSKDDPWGDRDEDTLGSGSDEDEKPAKAKSETCPACGHYWEK